MKTFKTKAGTELPMLDLRGKDYLQVAHRIQWFREEHPDWSIETEINPAQDYCVSKATIKDATGRIIATAHKQEDRKGFADFIEKSETGSIGRALALVGYGTQFAPELEEGERLADSPLPSKVPSKPAIAPKPVEQAKTSKSEETHPGLEEKKDLDALLKINLWSNMDALNYMKQTFGKDRLSLLTMGQYDIMLNAINTYKAEELLK